MSNYGSRKVWLFTINNPIRTYTFGPFENESWAVWQIEKGNETHTTHIQGVVGFKGSTTFKNVKKVVGQTAHIEPAKDIFKTIVYCCKEDTRLENGGPFVRGTLPNIGSRLKSANNLRVFEILKNFLPKTKSVGPNDMNKDLKDLSLGTDPLVKKDLLFLREKILSGLSLEDLTLNFYELTMKYYKYVLTVYKSVEKGILTLGPELKNKTQFTVLCGDTGLGKTTYTRLWSQANGKSLYFKPDDSIFFNGYSNQQVIVMDEFVSTSNSIGSINKLIDGFTELLPIKGGFVKTHSIDKLFLCSNEYLDDLFSSRGQILAKTVWRRVTTLIWLKKIEGKIRALMDIRTGRGPENIKRYMAYYEPKNLIYGICELLKIEAQILQQPLDYENMLARLKEIEIVKESGWNENTQNLEFSKIDQADFNSKSFLDID